MKFKIDENLPREIGDDLRLLGHPADTVESEGLSGAPDDHVLAAAGSEGRILLTLDKGIANIRQYPPGLHAGVVLFRPGFVGRGEVLMFVRPRLEQLLQLELEGRLTVVTRDGIRIR